MKKHKDLYIKEKRRHEETLQKYQENHMDEMEIPQMMQQDKSSRKDRCKGTPQRPIGVDITFFEGAA